MSHFLRLFKQQESHYISWNILFLWGFGLWIALCTSNMYHSDILAQEGILFYQLNSGFGIPYNISTKPEIIEDILHIMVPNTFSSVALVSRSYTDIFVFMCFIILFICMQERIRKKIVWSDIRQKSSLTIPYINSLVRKDNKNKSFIKEINSNDHIILQSEILVNSEISMEQKMLCHYQTEDECAWVEEKSKSILNTNITIVQNKIIFNGYTLLLFNNYELYRYFNNQQLKNTYNLLTKYSATQNSCMENNIKFTNVKVNNHRLERNIQKGIISSSPEFKKFLENLRKSRFFYPFMLEISTSYVISIKSIYK